MRRPPAVVIGLLLLAVLIAVVLSIAVRQGDLTRGPGIEGLRVVAVVPVAA